MNALETVLICSACHMLILPMSLQEWASQGLEMSLGKTKASGRQAAPTCYRDTHKARRIFLGPSNSFLLLSCPYWFGPSLPQCVPVVLIKHKYFIPTEWSRWKRTKKKKTKLQTFTLTLKKKNQKKKRKERNQATDSRSSTHSSTMTVKAFIKRHIIVKLLKTKKGTIVVGGRDITFKERTMTTNFPSDTIKARTWWNDIFKVLRQNKMSINLDFYS